MKDAARKCFNRSRTEPSVAANWAGLYSHVVEYEVLPTLDRATERLSESVSGGGDQPIEKAFDSFLTDYDKLAGLAYHFGKHDPEIVFDYKLLATWVERDAHLDDQMKDLAVSNDPVAASVSMFGLQGRTHLLSLHKPVMFPNREQLISSLQAYERGLLAEIDAAFSAERLAANPERDDIGTFTAEYIEQLDRAEGRRGAANETTQGARSEFKRERRIASTSDEMTERFEAFEGAVEQAVGMMDGTRASERTKARRTVEREVKELLRWVNDRS